MRPLPLPADVPSGNRAAVHVLLATYNGARHLREQWKSLEDQESVQVVVHVADDGSTDGTVALVEELASDRKGAIQDVCWHHGRPRGSAAASFMYLLANAASNRDARWFAFCDQDDIWLPGKLAAALQELALATPAKGPALYGGRTVAVDEENRGGRLSPLFAQPASFRNALAQNIMGGNTMVFNREAAELLVPSANSELVTHDWFTYQLVSGAGGLVRYDSRAFVRYRQHRNNVIGSNLGWRARVSRLTRMLRGDYRDWNRLQVAALAERMPALTAENQEVLQAFIHARQDAAMWERASWLRRSGVFRQKRAEHLMLWLACLLRRI